MFIFAYTLETNDMKIMIQPVEKIDYKKQLEEFISSGNTIAIQNMYNRYANMRNRTERDEIIFKALELEMSKNDEFGMFGLLENYN